MFAIPRLAVFAAVVSLAACQYDPPAQTAPPTKWADIQDVPADFADGKDDVRSDEEIRAAVVESDPVFSASPAAAITADDANNWTTAYEWGNHATAGYLTSESDPAFAASVAAGMSAVDVANWNAAHAWGNHAAAGYLTSETDPAFTASPAAGITSTHVSNWNQVYAWGNHANAGYLTSERDPKVGALTTGNLPRWNGNQLSDSVVSEANGNVGIAAAPGAAKLTVGTFAKFGAPIPSGTSKSCSMAGFSWTNTPPSASACNAYCTSRGFLSGAVGASGSKSCGGASCDFISDFETCTLSTMQNNGNCDTCATSFVCLCQQAGVELSGDVRVVGGKLGIGVSAPASPLQVNGYLQLGATAGAPPAADCNEASERGRMLIDPATSLLWICANSGWVSK